MRLLSSEDDYWLLGFSMCVVFSAAEALEKPEWMELTPSEEWSEEQKLEADAFDARKKKLQEEALQKRKELELELKKLKTEIGDAYKSFDEKVKAGIRRKKWIAECNSIPPLYTQTLETGKFKKYGIRSFKPGKMMTEKVYYKSTFKNVASPPNNLLF